MSTSARPSSIPGRSHKVMSVDFSNPVLRHYMRDYCAAHRAFLDGVRAQLPGWIEQARLEEARMGAPRPLAAVLDLDEVVFSNIHTNAFRAPAGAQGAAAVDFHAADFFRTAGGRPWPRDLLRLNPLLPGARELIADLQGRGLRVFFLSGRREDIRAETVENFEHAGLAAPGTTSGALLDSADLALVDGPLILCPKPPAVGQSIRPYKEARRRAIEGRYRIVVNVGDQASDLGLYGDAQVLVPNPFYWIP
jgi:phosphoglycolate phosphatase-like HAD superfamily hydrolase